MSVIEPIVPFAFPATQTTSQTKNTNNQGGSGFGDYLSFLMPPGEGTATDGEITQQTVDNVLTALQQQRTTIDGWLRASAAAHGRTENWTDYMARQSQASPASDEERLEEKLKNSYGNAIDYLLQWLDRRSVRESFLQNTSQQLANNPSSAEESITALLGIQQQTFTLAAARLGNNGKARSRVTGMDIAQSNFGMTQINMQISVSAMQGQLATGEDGGASLINLTGATVSVRALIQYFDPLVLDMSDDGIDLTGTDEGITFDLSGNGTQQTTGFIQRDDALLYLDENNDGVCSNGQEMFGNQNGAANGFEELAQYDENADHRIDSKDSIFFQLRLFNDWNTDGINQDSESRTLEEAGIRGIDLAYTDIQETDEHGNLFTQRGSFVRKDGSLGKVADAWFRTV